MDAVNKGAVFGDLGEAINKWAVLGARAVGMGRVNKGRYLLG